ncbi:hypothetical protein HOLleu_06444 [Holothuria leucospilota]|uniref:Sulfotransferase n=1 Tax=Holothuria leucospilota TaxID=206669 RepID=A0A9Q1CLH8_HOLLE|nr:hypothetical protein HOLleu_06444 [Holothuria leucospilota]
MSFSRYARPWIPTLVFVAVVLCLLLFINYNSGSPYDLEEEKPSWLSSLKMKRKPDSLPGLHWRDALPWEVAPKRFLPNYYTYKELLEKNDDVIYRRSNIVFMHIPRSGGTTMNTCFYKIAQNVKDFDKTVRFVTERNYFSAQKELDGHGETDKTVISGEFAFGSCDYLKDRPCAYVLLMRDPYERVISSYSFCKEYNDDDSDFHCSVRTDDLSVADFAVLEGSPMFRQIVAHPSACGEKFGNYFDFKNMINVPKGAVKNNKYPCWMKLKAFLDHKLTPDQTDELIEYVANNIERWFASVGILDKKNTFLYHLQDMFYIPTHNICSLLHKSNNTVPASQRELMLQQLKADPRVAKAMKADLTLYARVKEVVELQIKAHHIIHKK